MTDLAQSEEPQDGQGVQQAAEQPCKPKSNGFWDRLGLAALQYVHDLYVQTFSAKFEGTTPWQLRGMNADAVSTGLTQARMLLEGQQAVGQATFEAAISQLRQALHHYSEHAAAVDQHLQQQFLPSCYRMLDSWIDTQTLGEEQRNLLLHMRQASLNLQVLWLVWQVSRLVLEMLVLACPWRALRQRLSASLQTEDTQAVDSLAARVPPLEQQLRTYPRIRDPNAAAGPLKSIMVLRDLRRCYLSQVVSCMGLLRQQLQSLQERQQLLLEVLLQPDSAPHTIVQAIAVDVLDGCLPPKEMDSVAHLLREYEFLIKQHKLAVPAVMKAALKRLPARECAEPEPRSNSLGIPDGRRRVRRRQSAAKLVAVVAQQTSQDSAPPPQTPQQPPARSPEPVQCDTECAVCREEMREDTRVVLSCSLQSGTYASPHCVCTTCWPRLLSAQGGPTCPQCKREGVHVVFDVGSMESS